MCWYQFNNPPTFASLEFSYNWKSTYVKLLSFFSTNGEQALSEKLTMAIKNFHYYLPSWKTYQFQEMPKFK